MSVATEFPPDVYIPAAARPRTLRAVPSGLGRVDSPAPGVGRRSISVPAMPAILAEPAVRVVDLDQWQPQFVGAQTGSRRRNAAGLRTRPEAVASSPVRLTRRGLTVLLAAAALVAVAIVMVAWLSVPSTSGTAATGAGSTQVATVTVQPGDSLWTIATRVAPNRDPRSEIADLQKRNHLASQSLVPGQQLQVR
jgi:LysM repeat protein